MWVTSIAGQIYLNLSVSKSNILKYNFKYISEKYIKSRLKVLFLIFSLKEVN